MVFDLATTSATGEIVQNYPINLCRVVFGLAGRRLVPVPAARGRRLVPTLCESLHGDSRAAVDAMDGMLARCLSQRHEGGGAGLPFSGLFAETWRDAQLLGHR